MFLRLIREVGPTRAMVFTYVNPAVAVAGGVLLLGEPFTATIAAAFVLILAGCVLASGGRSVAKRHRGQPDQTSPRQRRDRQHRSDPDHAPAGQS